MPVLRTPTGFRPQRWSGIAAIAAVIMAGASTASTDLAAGLARPTLEQILEMRSIDGITLSPDGRQLAYRVVAPSVTDNRTTVQWFSVPVDGSTPATPLGKPTEAILMPMFESVLDEVAIWDPDSQSLYVRLLENSQIQIHRVGPDGSDKPVTNDEADVVSFRLAPDQRSLIYEVRNDRAAIDAAVEAEEHHGVHFDRGVSAEGSRITRNMAVGARRPTMRYVSSGAAEELNSGPVREKSVSLGPNPGNLPIEQFRGRTDSLNPKQDVDIGRWLPLGRTGVSVSLAETQPARPFLYTREVQILARLKGGAARPCTKSVCRDSAAMIRQVLPVASTGEVAILFERDYSGRTGIFVWNPRTDTIRTLLAPEQSLDGGAAFGTNRCSKLDDHLFCARADATRPADLVRIDLASGSVKVLAQPNLALASLKHFPGHYLEWTDQDGHAANGILLLPEGSGRPLPLVITSYRCRGYLQGGMSKLAAEQVLAADGFAVLCVNANNAVGMEPNDLPFAGYNGQLHSYEAIVNRLATEGLVDRSRVGFAGHSATSMVGALAVSTGKLFQAVVIGTGITTDPATYMFTEPTTDSWRKGMLEFFKMPHPSIDMKPWEKVSPALNASRIEAPLLIQPAENEYHLALQLFSGIQHAKGTVDMYVYPNEGHLFGREPAHQFWRNQRSIDWFSFWLMGKSRQSPETASQFAYWEQLRKDRSEPRSHPAD